MVITAKARTAGGFSSCWWAAAEKGHFWIAFVDFSLVGFWLNLQFSYVKRGNEHYWRGGWLYTLTWPFSVF